MSLKTVFAQICPTGKTLAPITGSAYPHQQDSFQGLQCRELRNLQTDPLVLCCPLMGGRTWGLFAATIKTAKNDLPRIYRQYESPKYGKSTQN